MENDSFCNQMWNERRESNLKKIEKLDACPVVIVARTSLDALRSRIMTRMNDRRHEICYVSGGTPNA